MLVINIVLKRNAINLTHLSTEAHFYLYISSKVDCDVKT